MASTVADESGFIDRTEEDKGTGFGFFPQAPAPPEDDVVQRALTVLEGRLRLVGPSVTSPQAVKDYLRLRLAGLEHEVFVVLFLDSQHRLIATEKMFRGTLASVHPREVVKAALKHNAAAVIFAHSHPSGLVEPSRADELLTQALKQALAGGAGTVSFVERGLL